MGAEKHHPLGAPRLPLWTDGPAASLAKWEEENLSEQGSPSGDPTSCQISWGNSLTPRSPFPHWSDRNHADDSLAECPVRGQCSVSVDSHHVVIFILLLHLSSQGEAGVTSQRQQITQARGVTLGTPIHTLSSHCPFN